MSALTPSFIGLDYYFGSGKASSVLAPISPSNSNVLSSGSRIPHSLFNLRLASPRPASPRLAGYGTLSTSGNNARLFAQGVG